MEKDYPLSRSQRAFEEFNPFGKMVVSIDHVEVRTGRIFLERGVLRGV